MTQIDPDVQAELDAIRTDFESRLGAMIGDITDALNKAGSSDDPVAGLKKVGELAHSLAGNAGILGLGKVSRAARELEVAIDGRLATSDQGEANMIDLSPLVDNLRATATVPVAGQIRT